jgi:hypothetical protein
VSKITFYEGPDALFQYEVFGKNVFLHCTVAEWKPSTIKKGYRVLGDFMYQMQKQGYEHIFAITPNPKFAKLFGGTFVSDITYEDKQYEVVVWDLRQHS